MMKAIVFISCLVAVLAKPIDDSQSLDEQDLLNVTFPGNEIFRNPTVVKEFVDLFIDAQAKNICKKVKQEIATDLGITPEEACLVFSSTMKIMFARVPLLAAVQQFTGFSIDDLILEIVFGKFKEGDIIDKLKRCFGTTANPLDCIEGIVAGVFDNDLVKIIEDLVKSGTKIAETLIEILFGIFG